METKFYKWSAPFSDENTIDQVLMIQQGTSCRVNDFGINQKIEFYDYELYAKEMTSATREEFIKVYSKVNGEMLSRILNTIL